MKVLLLMEPFEHQRRYPTGRTPTIGASNLAHFKEDFYRKECSWSTVLYPESLSDDFRTGE